MKIYQEQLSVLGQRGEIYIIYMCILLKTKKKQQNSTLSKFETCMGYT